MRVPRCRNHDCEFLMHLPRPECMKIGGIELSFPVFFPSVSSVKTALPLLDYVRLLSALRAINGQFLVSAFDLAHSGEVDQQTLREVLGCARNPGTVVMMDSGNYESYWKGAKDRWSQTDFHSVLRSFPCSLAFGFDAQDPPHDQNDHVQLIIDRFDRDQAAGGEVSIVPIIHGTAQLLPDLCAKVARISGALMIAVPERRLGDGVFERAQTVKAIRESLDAQGQYVGLHLLGTGNPISIALYSIAGADSFDGLEWCQTVVDYESGLLFHLSQADFFKGQSRWGDGDLPFQAFVLAHNLEFYADWLSRLRQAIHAGEGIAFARSNFPQRSFNQCSTALGWAVQT